MLKAGRPAAVAQSRPVAVSEFLKRNRQPGMIRPWVVSGILLCLIDLTNVVRVQLRSEMFEQWIVTCSVDSDCPQAEFSPPIY
ncbi:hypothetical protein Y032_0170g270 [Ancylostoma ceylanicum]|uniref:Uncharacterized protein n=1 Tax=Ancylostoma ceylanicum TaxID=53326 RepID=A0A016SV71_9BILA|nr:hypothetical protein Y032_0170g270 [Ancylostoma ceylanicum]